MGLIKLYNMGLKELTLKEKVKVLNATVYQLNKDKKETYNFICHRVKESVYKLYPKEYEEIDWEVLIDRIFPEFDKWVNRIAKELSPDDYTCVWRYKRTKRNREGKPLRAGEKIPSIRAFIRELKSNELNKLK